MARPPLTTPTPLHRPQLGSGSASRRHVLEKAGVQHRVVKPDIDERAIRHEDPVALVEALARAKADALLARWRGKDADAGPTPDFLITCDQVVVCNGEICEKPEDRDEAVNRWVNYRTANPETVGSVLVTHVPSGKSQLRVDRATIELAPMPDADIDALVAEGEIFHCAGALMVENPLVVPYVQRIRGTPDAVLGLSMATVEEGMLAVAPATL